MNNKSVSFIIVTRNGSEYIYDCLNSIKQSLMIEKIHHNIQIIDNGSYDINKTKVNVWFNQCLTSGFLNIKNGLINSKM